MRAIKVRQNGKTTGQIKDVGHSYAVRAMYVFVRPQLGKGFQVQLKSAELVCLS